jgi:hypothetical protein
VKVLLANIVYGSKPADWECVHYKLARKFKEEQTLSSNIYGKCKVCCSGISTVNSPNMLMTNIFST